MKKQIIILAAAIMPLAFLSCSKEKIETQQTNNSNPTGEIAFKPVIKPVAAFKTDLSAQYEFDGNLKEKTGQLADAVTWNNWVETYTDDRKGNPKSAIKFTGRYGIDIFKIPLKLNMSLAAWVKYDQLAPSTNYFVTAQWLAPDFTQDNDNFWGVISTPGTSGVPSGSVDDQWHHLVATYDGIDLKFYVDGNYIGSSQNKYVGLPYSKEATVNYKAGYNSLQGSKDMFSSWFGSIDELRFYARTLSGADIKALYLQ